MRSIVVAFSVGIFFSLPASAGSGQRFDAHLSSGVRDSLAQMTMRERRDARMDRREMMMKKQGMKRGGAKGGHHVRGRADMR